MEIYRLGARLFMVMDADNHFSFEAKAADDLQNPKASFDKKHQEACRSLQFTHDFSELSTRMPTRDRFGHCVFSSTWQSPVAS